MAGLAAPWMVKGTVRVVPALAVLAAERFGVKRTADRGRGLGVVPGMWAERKVHSAEMRVLTGKRAVEREMSVVRR